MAVKADLPAVAGDPQRLDRFLREGRNLRKLKQPHIVRFLDRRPTCKLFFFATDDIHGVSVEEWLRSPGPLQVNGVQRLVNQLLKALGTPRSKRLAIATSTRRMCQLKCKRIKRW